MKDIKVMKKWLQYAIMVLLLLIAVMFGLVACTGNGDAKIIVNDTVSLTVGDISPINASVENYDGLPDFSYSSSNENVVIIEDGSIVAITAGSATITVTAMLEGTTLQATIAVTVSPKTETTTKATVTFISEGEVVQSSEVEVGSLIVPPSQNPTKESTVQYTYTFVGWKGYSEGMTVSGDVTFEAQFSETVNQYRIDFMVDGEIYQSYTLAYGTTINLPENPVKESTVQYSYTFTGWKGYSEGMTVSGDVTFEAQFSETVNQYRIDFMVDGEIYQSYTLAYGTIITPPEKNPTKIASTQYIYTFESWQGYSENMTVSRDISFEAVFTRTVDPATEGTWSAVQGLDSVVTSSNFDVRGIALRVPEETYNEAAKFHVTMSEALYETLLSQELVKTGTLIAKVSSLGAGETLEIGTADAINIETTNSWYEIELNDTKVMESIVFVYDLKDIPYFEDICVVGYYELTDGTIVYSQSIDGISIAEIAVEEYVGGSSTLTEGQKTTLINTYGIFEVIYTYNDNYSSSTEVKYGEKLELPDEPFNPGEEFLGWFDATDEQWDFSNDVVTENVSLYAKFEPLYSSKGFNIEGTSNDALTFTTTGNSIKSLYSVTSSTSVVLEATISNAVNGVVCNDFGAGFAIKNSDGLELNIFAFASAYVRFCYAGNYNYRYEIPFTSTSRPLTPNVEGSFKFKMEYYKGAIVLYINDVVVASTTLDEINANLTTPLLETLSGEEEMTFGLSALNSYQSSSGTFMDSQATFTNVTFDMSKIWYKLEKYSGSELIATEY